MKGWQAKKFYIQLLNPGWVLEDWTILFHFSQPKTTVALNCTSKTSKLDLILPFYLSGLGFEFFLPAGLLLHANLGIFNIRVRLYMICPSQPSGFRFLNSVCIFVHLFKFIVSSPSIFSLYCNQNWALYFPENSSLEVF